MLNRLNSAVVVAIYSGSGGSAYVQSGVKRAASSCDGKMLLVIIYQ